MSWLGFLIFLAISLWYMWNGKDSFSKKDWLLFAAKVIGVLIGTALFGRLMYNMITSWHFMPMSDAKKLTASLGGACIAVLGSKFLIVALCSIFSNIMGFHKEYNTQNYEKLSSFSKSVSPSLLLFVKCLVSAASALMLYGIWLGR